MGNETFYWDGLRKNGIIPFRCFQTALRNAIKSETLLLGKWKRKFGSDMTSSIKKNIWTGLDKRGLAKHTLLKRKQQKRGLLKVDL